MMQITVPSKWVLTGEHSVLAGKHAIALPLHAYSLTLSFTPFSNPRFDPMEVHPPEMQPLIKRLLERLQNLTEEQNFDLKWPKGYLTLKNDIPIGAGLGSSASLCVALIRSLGADQKLDQEQIIELARRLENEFHGRSSGMDIAVIAQDKPIVFSKEKGVESWLELNHLPPFQFYDTGLRTRTNECVSQVNQLRSQHPSRAAQLDQQMEKATQSALQALRAYANSNTTISKEAFNQLADAMNLGQDCFRCWGLIPSEIENQEKELFEQGARGVKLTGAGKGGILVALF